MQRLALIVLTFGILTSSLLADEVVRGAVRPLAASTAFGSVRPLVAKAALGQTLVAWTEATPFATTIRYLVLDPAGDPIVPATTLATGPVSPERLAVAASSVGFILAYSGTGGSDGVGTGIYYQIFDHGGVPTMAGAARANALTDRDERWPAAAGLWSGGFALTWIRETPLTPGSSEGVFLRRVDIFGVPTDGVEVRVDDPTQSRGYQRFTGVTAWPSGRLAVVWQDGAASASLGSPLSADGWGTAVRGRWLGGGLAFRSADLVLPLQTTRDQLEPRIAADQRAGCVVGWTHETTDTRTDGVLRRFDDGGIALSADRVITASSGTSRFLTGLAMTSSGEHGATCMDAAAIASTAATLPIRVFRFAQDDAVIEALDIAPSNGAHGYGTLALDQFGNLDVAWQTLLPAAGGGVLAGATQQALTRSMISITPAAPTLGSVIGITLDSPSDGGRGYQLAVSASPGLLLIDNRWVKANPDVVFFASVSGSNGFNSFAGVLQGDGTTSSPSFTIPNQAVFQGAELHMSFITLDPMAPSGINTVSDEFVVTIQ